MSIWVMDNCVESYNVSSDGSDQTGEAHFCIFVASMWHKNIVPLWGKHANVAIRPLDKQGS